MRGKEVSYLPPLTHKVILTKLHCTPSYSVQVKDRSYKYDTTSVESFLGNERMEAYGCIPRNKIIDVTYNHYKRCKSSHT